MPKRILVVDDDPSIRSFVADVLALDGYEVDTAADGRAALQAVELHRPDCIVLDVMMPGVDGHEVLTTIRRGEYGTTMPVVMLTANAGDDQAWQAWTGGVDYFLAKPFEPDELLRYLDYLFANQPAC